MSDPNQPDQQQGFALGGLGAGAYDSELSQPAPEGEALELPRAALLAFRKSGGLRFSSREIVVYRDGWVVSTDEETYGRVRHLGAGELDWLAHQALRARLARHRPAGAAQPPDGYAYEVAAWVGRRLRRAEVMTGALPAELRPLIRALEALLGGGPGRA